MPVPDFSPGEVLTAAAMDSIGLWLVKTQTIGAGVTSQLVTNAFSADYDDYYISVSGGAASGVPVLGLQLEGLTTSVYYQSYIYTSWNNTVAADSGLRAQWVYCGSGTAGGLHMQATMQSPFLAKNTRCNAMGSSSSSTFVGNLNGWVDNTTSYTGFTVIASSGTLTGGTIRVYGYRK